MIDRKISGYRTDLHIRRHQSLPLSGEICHDTGSGAMALSGRACPEPFKHKRPCIVIDARPFVFYEAPNREMPFLCPGAHLFFQRAGDLDCGAYRRRPTVYCRMLSGGGRTYISASFRTVFAVRIVSFLPTAALAVPGHQFVF